MHKRTMQGWIYDKRPVGRPKDRRIDAVGMDAKQLLGITTWRRALVDKSALKRNIEEVVAVGYDTIEEEYVQV